MNYNSLNLDHFNFFCPATGVHILGDEHCDDSAQSLRAYWVSDAFDEPVIKDPTLVEAWSKFSDEFAAKNEGSTAGDKELEQFLKSYREPNWATFEITTCGMSCGPTSSTVWFVIDMNTEVEEDETA